ncbi:M64 family metallopeptidase [Streptosporangium lutulentum]
MGFWGGCNPTSVQRLITMSNSAANRYANMVPGTSSSNRQIVALANSGTYGGAGGAYATASGHNSMSALIAPHEIGHSLGNLQDEYPYYSRGVDGGAYTGGEPGSVHHTLLTEQQMKDQQKKWWRWLGEPSEAGGTIGRFEGGLYTSSGVWRPSQHSIMKTLGYYYDQVSREIMIQKISAKVSLIQSSTPTTSPVGADRVLWVEPLHPNSHSLTTTWQVDGTALPGQGTEIDLRTLNLSPGRHTVTATVVDPTDFVRAPDIRASNLTATRTWTVDTSVTTVPGAAAPASSPPRRRTAAWDATRSSTSRPPTPTTPSPPSSGHWTASGSTRATRTWTSAPSASRRERTPSPPPPAAGRSPGPWTTRPPPTTSSPSRWSARARPTSTTAPSP